MSKLPHLVMVRPHLEQIPDIKLPEGYTIRNYNGEEDLEGLAFVLSGAFNYPWDMSLVRTKLTNAPDVKAVYLITWNKQIVATASSRYIPERFPGSGYVHWVGTAPDHTRKGLSSALIARVLMDFRERSYRDALLETDDFRIPAIKSYLKFGFLPKYQVADEDHSARWSSVFQVIFDNYRFR